MDRKKLEKLAWQKTHKDYKSPWNKGDCTLLHFVPGQGTSAVPISQFTDEELAVKAGLRRAKAEIARILKENGLPALPEDLDLLDSRFSMGTSDWHVLTDKGWFYCDGRSKKEWKPSLYGPTA